MNEKTKPAIDLANAEIVAIFECSKNSDLTEGRGQQVVYAHAWTQATAQRLARKQGVQGTDAQVSSVLAIKIGNTIYAPTQVQRPTDEDTQKDRVLDARNRAVAKAKQAGLTDEELALLRNPQ